MFDFKAETFSSSLESGCYKLHSYKYGGCIQGGKVNRRNLFIQKNFKLKTTMWKCWWNTVESEKALTWKYFFCYQQKIISRFRIQGSKVNRRSVLINSEEIQIKDDHVEMLGKYSRRREGVNVEILICYQQKTISCFRYWMV